MPLNLSRILSPCSIKKVRDLYCLDENPICHHFSDINHTDPSSLSFWDGSYTISNQLSGNVLVSSSEQYSLLSQLYSSKFSDCLKIVVCDAPLPSFFWRFLSEIVTPNDDEGSLLASGDL